MEVIWSSPERPHNQEPAKHDDGFNATVRITGTSGKRADGEIRKVHLIGILSRSNRRQVLLLARRLVFLFNKQTSILVRQGHLLINTRTSLLCLTRRQDTSSSSKRTILPVQQVAITSCRAGLVASWFNKKTCLPVEQDEMSS